MSNASQRLPECPSWCVTDHERDSVHRGAHAYVNSHGQVFTKLPGWTDTCDIFGVRARWSGFGAAHVYISNRTGPFVDLGVVPGEGPTGEPAEEGLAALVEALADVTPEAHRQIAAAIRAAAAAIVGGSDA